MKIRLLLRKCNADKTDTDNSKDELMKTKSCKSTAIFPLVETMKLKLHSIYMYMLYEVASLE